MEPQPNGASRFVTLIDDGDVELWLARGKAGKDWQLPLYAHPKSIDGTGQPLYYCVPAVPNLQPHHHIALNNHFARHRLNVDSAFWVIDRETLPMICQKAPGLTPAYYVHWNGERVNVPHGETAMAELSEPAEANAPSPDGERFIEYFLANSGLFERDVMRLFWREFRRVAMLWLGTEREPLDLGFLKIVPLPYRANWREITAARHPKIPAILKTSSGAQRTALLVFFKVYDTLSNLLIAAMNPRGACHWTLNLLVEPKLRTLLDKNEDAILKSMGPESYASHVFEQMQRRQNYAMAILAQYSEQTGAPCGSTTPSPTGFGKRIIPHIPEGAIRPVAPSIPKVFAVARDTWQELTGPDRDDTCEVVAVETPGMPDVSALRPQLEDVRDTGENNHELSGRNGE